MVVGVTFQKEEGKSVQGDLGVFAHLWGGEGMLLFHKDLGGSFSSSLGERAVEPHICVPAGGMGRWRHGSR